MKNSQKKIDRIEPKPEMYDLFKSEIRINTGKIQAALSLYLQNHSLQEIKFILRSIDSLLSASKIVGLKISCNHLNKLESYLRSNISLDPEQVAIMSEIINLFAKCINYRDIENYFQNVDEKLTLKINSLHLKAKQNEKIDVNTFNMIIGEINKQTKIIENVLISEENLKLAEIRRMKKSASVLKRNLKVIDKNMIYQVAENFEKIFEKAEQINISLNELQIDTLLRANDLLASLSELEKDELQLTLQHEKAIIEDHIDELEIALNSFEENDITEIENEVNYNTDIIKYDKYQAFKNDINELSNAIEQNIDKIEFNAEMHEISEAVSFIKFSSSEIGLEKLFNLSNEFEKAISRIIINLESDTNTIDILRQVNAIFKKIAATSIKDLIDNIENNSLEIDNYLDNLTGIYPENVVDEPILKHSEIIDKQNQLQRITRNYFPDAVVNVSKDNIHSKDEQSIFEIIEILHEFISNDYDILISNAANNEISIDIDETDSVYKIQIRYNFKELNIINIKKDIYYYQVKSNSHQISDDEALALIFDPDILKYKYPEFQRLNEILKKDIGLISIKNNDGIEIIINLDKKVILKTLLLTSKEDEFKIPMLNIEKLVDSDQGKINVIDNISYFNYIGVDYKIKNNNELHNDIFKVAIIKEISFYYALIFEEIAGIEEVSKNKL